MERLVFLTGHLAKARLERLLGSLGETDFAWQVVDIGVKVAALMTEEIILRRLTLDEGVDRVVLPGRCRGDLGAAGARISACRSCAVPTRSPTCRPFSAARACRRTSPATTCASSPRSSKRRCCRSMRWSSGRGGSSRAGADVIDLGCLPDTPFPGLAEAVRALKAEGLAVSVDSADRDELATGIAAGADFVLSLTEETLPLARDQAVTPVLIPAVPGDLDSLGRAIEAAARAGMAVHRRSGARSDPFRLRGLAGALRRGAAALARGRDADGHRQPHRAHRRRQRRGHGGARRALLGARDPQRADRPCQPAHGAHRRGARRRPPHALRRPAATEPCRAATIPACCRCTTASRSRRALEDIEALAAAVRDANFRIQTAEDGIHVFNSKGHRVAGDAFALFEGLGVETDGAHAFYLGAELMKAEIAWRLGKRYAQDEPLDFGVAAPPPEADRTRLKEAGHTLKQKKG